MLAPMEGVSHPLFRQIISERGGVGVVCTEFVRVVDTTLAPSVIRREVVKVKGIPLCVQVMGNAAEHMADSAAAVADAGADIIDINLGCPAPRAVRKGVGSAMLRDPKLLYQVLSAMRQAIAVTLSAKIRAGFDDADNVLHIGETLQRAGADYLVVHPRRRSDFYNGVADWRIIARLKEHLDIPVVGNGDCWYAKDALRLEEETG
jgi:tRNA-dihydrouridine synthase